MMLSLKPWRWSLQLLVNPEASEKGGVIHQLARPFASQLLHMQCCFLSCLPVLDSL